MCEYISRASLYIFSLGSVCTMCRFFFRSVHVVAVVQQKPLRIYWKWVDECVCLNEHGEENSQWTGMNKNRVFQVFGEWKNNA